MARTDAIVLGAGIVGTSIALHLAKRGLSVALVDRRRSGRGAPPTAMPGSSRAIPAFRIRFRPTFGALLRIALKRAPEANYHLAFLPHVAPWLSPIAPIRAIERRIRFANLMRPLFARGARRARDADAGGRRDAISAQGTAGSRSIARKAAFAATARERELAAEFRSAVRRARSRRRAGARAGAGAGDSATASSGRSAASVTNPLAVTRAYAARFTALGGVVAHAAMRARCIAPTSAGASRPTRARSMPARRWSRSVPGRPICWRRSDIHLPHGGEARLSPAFPPARQCRPDAPGGRRRCRLLRGADGAGPPPHHRRRIRRPRRAADAGAVRPPDAAGA